MVASLLAVREHLDGDAALARLAAVRSGVPGDWPGGERQRDAVRGWVSRRVR